MLIDLLLVLGIILVFMLLSPCSPLAIWKRDSCRWKAKAPDDASPPKPH